MAIKEKKQQIAGIGPVHATRTAGGLEHTSSKRFFLYLVFFDDGDGEHYLIYIQFSRDLVCL